MLPIKKLIVLVVKSLGRGVFILKLTAIQARSQVLRSLSVAVPPAKPSYSPAWFTRPANCHGESQRKPCCGPDLPSKRTLSGNSAGMPRREIAARAAPTRFRVLPLLAGENSLRACRS
jgi:hypothetical protein